MYPIYKYGNKVYDTVKLATESLIKIFENNNFGKGELSNNLDNMENFND